MKFEVEIEGDIISIGNNKYCLAALLSLLRHGRKFEGIWDETECECGESVELLTDLDLLDLIKGDAS